MFLCDMCNAGWHMDCFVSTLTTIPTGMGKCLLCTPWPPTLSQVSTRLLHPPFSDSQLRLWVNTAWSHKKDPRCFTSPWFTRALMQTWNRAFAQARGLERLFRAFIQRGCGPAGLRSYNTQQIEVPAKILDYFVWNNKSEDTRQPTKCKKMKYKSMWNLSEDEMCKWVKSTSRWNLKVGETRAQRIVGENWFLWNSAWKESVRVKKERVKKSGWKKVVEKRWVKLEGENAWVKIGGCNKTGELE